MIPLAISAHGWQEHPGAACNLVLRAIETGFDAVLVVDASAVEREARLFPDASRCELAAHYVDFNSWLKDGFEEDGVLDVHAIKLCAQTLSPDRTVVVDVRGRRLDLVRDALTHVRYAWFPLDEWHPAFVLICDDLDLTTISSMLATTFYCQPRVLSERQLNLRVKNIMRNASTQRWLGPGAGRWQRRWFRHIRIITSLFGKQSRKPKAT
ncbi:hypothetical protein [Paraburkholderia caballeronis]|uniref:hypothetical protein n=1 Tax=Paraburkholderia caballeronis TaxID=416943 RepID=UPI0010650CA5|nr:hypothetical protein [Paraburkholderia caballeronis]TDV11127.1 hypothetical protein C7408_113140 [Paraburkholderia caballeronis]TDV14183.1 hypothetical protein C7406_11418 [Paraburkholderia caballeronis]TDV23348.1 hypothetical protein C7404_11318 [Paraburkholderia caballeronis]